MPVDLPIPSPSDALGADASFGVSVGESPTVGAVPLWVTGCLLFDPPPVAAANAVSTAVAMLMAASVRVHGDLMVKLSPTRLALLCGYERPEKAKWIIDYLQRIGFLQVMDGGVNPVTGRRQARRDSAGRAIENEFVVFPTAPAHYRGPRSLAELDRWISADLAAAESAPARGGRRSGRPRTVSIRRRTLFTVPAGQALPPSRGEGEGNVPPARGEGNVSAGQAHPPAAGSGRSPLPPAGGGGNVSAGQALPPARGVLQIERSSISPGGREIEEIEPVPGGSAAPPATGPAAAAVAAAGSGGPAVAFATRPATAAAAAAASVAPPAGLVGGEAGPVVPAPGEHVRAVVRRLPWAAWAEHRRPGWRLSAADADQVQAAITEAITSQRITLDQATEIGQAALSEAKGPQPVTYLVNAFTKHLPRRLRALNHEPLDTAPLPLLTPTGPSEPFSQPQKRSPAPNKAAATAAAQQAVQDQGSSAAAALDTADTALDTAPASAVPPPAPGPATPAVREAAMASIRHHLAATPAGRRHPVRHPGTARQARPEPVTV
ncbi:hypothetical protein [Pseudonocardia sp. Ae331_Ps2]|uniref:hypothetical protein n=1 Tax=Pseudonocardia sp. Ae331_Ps2 TaxID=1885031 RepID=UPI0011150C65|nr:hypothetical protein [Pseudonocardia sp. Ae331_Ps2]